MIHINLYTMECEKNKLDKTNDLTLVKAMTGTFRSAVNIYSPTIILDNSKLLKFNYAYIQELHRYYFVTDIQITTTNSQIVALREDVLMSFKTSIKSQSAMIERSESNYDDMIQDGEITAISSADYTTIEATGATDSFDVRSDIPDTQLRYILIHNEVKY